MARPISQRLVRLNESVAGAVDCSRYSATMRRKRCSRSKSTARRDCAGSGRRRRTPTERSVHCIMSTKSMRFAGLSDIIGIIERGPPDIERRTRDAAALQSGPRDRWRYRQSRATAPPTASGTLTGSWWGGLEIFVAWPRQPQHAFDRGAEREAATSSATTYQRWRVAMPPRRPARVFPGRGRSGH
jgi:hypothetical protein